MKHDTVFRGCMRPAMFMGVPMMPFMLAFALFTLPALYFSFFIILGLPVVIFIMQQLVKYDEHVFDLMFLKLNTKIKSNSATKIDKFSLHIAPMNSEYKAK